MLFFAEVYKYNTCSAKILNFFHISINMLGKLFNILTI